MIIPDIARDLVLLARDQRERPIGTLARGEELDGQALLTRLKVAALLALLEGRTMNRRRTRISRVWC